MADAISREQAIAQAWEKMLAKASEAQGADPKAAAAAKTLLTDPAWEKTIEADVTVPPIPGTVEKAATLGPQAQAEEESTALDGYTEVPWQVVYPGYINGQLAFGVPFDEARTEKEKTLVIENIQWGSATSV